MSGLEVLTFFVVTGLVSVTVNMAVTGDSTLGASGGALAFVGFYRANPLCRTATHWRWIRVTMRL